MLEKPEGKAARLQGRDEAARQQGRRGRRSVGARGLNVLRLAQEKLPVA